MAMIRRFILCLLLMAFCSGAHAAQTNAIVWHKADDRVDADVRGMALWPLLEQIAAAADWRIFVEPGLERDVSAKFQNLSSGDALKMLLGDLNFALVPKTNAPSQLYVFRTTMQNATKQIRAGKTPRKVANELLVRVKPGTDMDALAKLIGAKIVARSDKDGIYRLRFDDEAATDAALNMLKNNNDVTSVDYNYYLDPPASPQLLNGVAPLGDVNLKLTPSTDSGKVVIGLIDTSVQSLGDLDKFISQRLSVADGTPDNSDLLHGTGMAETILRALAAAQDGNSSVQIVSVDVYGSGATATTWNVALGIQAAVNNGANILNLSLGGAGESSVLNSLVQQAVAAGIPIYAAAGNEPVNTATYPAAYTGVHAVTATQNGQLASYANYGSFIVLALPGQNIVYLGNQAYIMQGTSVSTAYATGIAAGNKVSSGASWGTIEAAMQQKFPMPATK